MPSALARRLRSRLFHGVDVAAGHFAAGTLRVLRLFPRQASASFAAAVARALGPLFKENRIGRANLAAAFPEKPPEEIERILSGVWDNLGRSVAEFAHLDRIRTRDAGDAEPSDVAFDPASRARFVAMMEERRPALVFACHLGNWELPAQIAHSFGLDTVVLYRRPNLGAVADAVQRIRAGSMGTLVATTLDAPVQLAQALADKRIVAMLVDQYYTRGVEVTFFGRRTRANPLIARLARQIDVPIHGTRTVRLPGGRFRAEFTEAIAPARDAQGRVDVAGTMQKIMDVVEGWVRETPEQWLWLHRRWRSDEEPFQSRF